MEGYKIRRTWMYYGLLLWLMSIDYLTGMTFKVILFLLPFLLVTRVKKEWILLLFVLRLCLLPVVYEEVLDSEFLIKPQVFKEYQQDLFIGNKKYLYYGKESLIRGRGRLKVLPFSKDRKDLFSEYDHYVSKGYVGKVEIEKIDKEAPLKEELRLKVLLKLYEKCRVFDDGQNLAFSLLFGSKDALLPEEKEELMQVGIMHLFVLSGLHFGIYERLLTKALKRAYVPKILRTGVIVMLFLLLNILSDFHPSSLRFLILFILKEVDFYRREELDTWERFFLSAIIILFINPAFATSLSFILGVVAHGSLLFFKKYSVFFLQVCLLPLQLLFHGIFSPIYLIYNFILIMMMPVLLMLLWVGFILPPLALIPSLILKAMEWTITSLQGVHLLKMTLMMPSPFVYILLVLGAILALMQYQNKPFFDFYQKIKPCFIILLLLSVITTQVLGTRGLRKGVHFLNVYQGDACLIFTNEGETILIDTGNEEVLFDHLRRLGVFHIDHLFITHLDDDHSKFMDTLSVTNYYTSPYAPISGAIPLTANNQLKMGDVTIQVLSPHKDFQNNNDNSLVLRVIKDGYTYLLAGDVSGEHHKKEWNEGVDVLKFSHHGSIHSLNPKTMETLKPKITILSYGRNTFGHPSPEVEDFFSSSYLHHTFYHGSLQITEKGYRAY